MKQTAEYLSVAVRAAKAAGAIIRAAQGGPLQVRHKGVIDLVTQVDEACEAEIRSILEKETPGVAILAEESGGAWGADTRWLVDPLDGTTNFVHGYPSYGVSIGLEIDGVMAIGCIYDPIQDRMFTASRGGGAFCGDQPLRVSNIKTLNASLLLTGFPYDRRDRPDYYLRFVRSFLIQAQGLRRAGAASMDFVAVACGQADGFWEIGLSPWDVAAGTLLVQEAGGVVTGFGDEPMKLEGRRMLASNGFIHEEMNAVLRDLLSSE